MGLPDLKAIEQSANGVLLRIRVQPRASRNEIVGLHGDTVRVRLSAPPVDGQANDELIRFLSQQLDVPRSAVRLVSWSQQSFKDHHDQRCSAGRCDSPAQALISNEPLASSQQPVAP